MNTNAHFKVDPRLASLLGENYRSTELAIKELIDNSFDADAANVWIELPNPLSNDPIVIRDDGTGMTENEVRNEYLKIASSRASRKGERTKLRNRLVKGRKGIGKFAGLMVASLMELRTETRGKQTYLKVWRDELIKTKDDLEQIDLPLEVNPCDPQVSGTEIILSGINQNYTFPNPDRLRRLLMLEYGRMPEFRIYVDGELIDIEDIPGDQFEHDLPLSNGEVAQLRFTISDGKKPLPQSGIAFRVGGKIVGNPQYFGLNDGDEIPAKLLRRVYGEINSDSLEADVTADWGSIVDNSKTLVEIRNKVRPILEDAFGGIFSREMDASRTRLKRRINGSLDKLPDYRKRYAQQLLDQVLRKFYGESETRIAAIVSLLLEAFQKNDYWLVMQDVEESRQGGTVDKMVDAFSAFGMLDIALIAQQSSHRLALLKDIEQLIFNPKSTPETIHKAIANNLWMLGNQYAMISTNQELRQVVEMYIGRKFTNGHAKFAPNLLLIQDFNKRFLLLDLKEPDSQLEPSDRRKALEYQSDLKVFLPGRDIEVLIIGGALAPGMVHQRTNTDVRFLSYKGMLSDARVQLNWLIKELNKR